MTEMTIIVEFETLEGAEPEFTRLICEHASRSRAEEPGCLRFDVVKPVDGDGAPLPNRIVITETYADQAALDLHSASPRLAQYRQASSPLLKSRRMILARAVGTKPAEQGMSPADLNAANDD